METGHTVSEVKINPELCIVEYHLMAHVDAGCDETYSPLYSLMSDTNQYCSQSSSLSEK